MGMKPRIEQPNKKIDPKLCSEPHTSATESSQGKIAPVVVTEHKPMENSAIPGCVSAPRRH